MVICRRGVFLGVLKVDIHEGRVDEILQTTKNFPGVDEAHIDRFASRPTMTATGNIDPKKLGDWIEKKTKHKVEVLRSAEEQQAYRQAHAEHEHHGDGGSRCITITILKILGLEQLTIDRKNHRIIAKTVKGTMKANGFAEHVSKKMVEPKTEKRCNGQTACQARRGVAAVTIAAIRSACCLRWPPAHD